MTKLISAHFVRNEAHCIQKMLDSLLPHVEQTYVMIDDRTLDRTQEICEANGCIVKSFKFENFGKTWNTLLKWVNDKGDWSFFLAPDETISSSFGDSLCHIVEEFSDTDVDGVWFPRRHWADLERKLKFEKDAAWFPDRQLRLIKNDYPRIYAVHYVHEVMVGLRRTVMLKDKEIDHYNSYWKPRINYNWDKMNELYESLKQQQQKDGGINIWPEENV